MKTNILGVGIDVVTRQEALEKVLGFLQTDELDLIVTPNSEIITLANKDKVFFDIIQNASLVVPDGIGVVFASRLNDQKLTERVSGYDLVKDLFERNAPLNVYILGANEGVPQRAKDNIERLYSNVKVVGLSNGYFDGAAEKQILDEIIALKPDLLLVGLGAARQEKWIEKNKKTLEGSVKVAIGIGGAIDVFSGYVKRAPDVFIKLNLEWFYRMATDPKRFLRIGGLVSFAVNVLWKDFWRKRNEKNN